MYNTIAMDREKHSLPAHRVRLAAVLRAAKEVVSVDTASRTLNIERRAAAKVLCRPPGGRVIDLSGRDLCLEHSKSGSCGID